MNIGEDTTLDFKSDNQNLADRETKEGRRVLHYYFAEGEIRHLMGQILTIVDATLPDPKQNKAVKDLMKHKARIAISSLQNYCFGGEGAHSVQFDNE